VVEATSDVGRQTECCQLGTNWMTTASESQLVTD